MNKMNMNKMNNIYNKYMLFLILILLLILVYFFWKKSSKESFYQFSFSGPIILLGDSILKNNDYINHNSIEQMLRRKTNRSVYCLAKNAATISNVYDQLEKVSINWNTPSTQIFLSIGGNNILNNYKDCQYSNKCDSNGSLEKDYFLDDLFLEYKDLVDSIKARMNKSNIVLLDIYYPYSKKECMPVIQDWNDKLKYYANTSKNKILLISENVTDSEDFIYDIEPSERGGYKIVNAILNA